MHSEKLFKKYSEGKHWENHPEIYAESFSEFLKKRNFKGLIVDVGCGNGRDVKAFQSKGFRALGLDISEEEIINDRKKFPELKFEVQNTENLKFENNSVEAFFMINVIHYVDKEKTIQEVFSKLKPKGYFFVHFNIEISDKNGKIDYKQSQPEILRMVSKFKILEKNILERTDRQPVEHRHKILELILQKPCR